MYGGRDGDEDMFAAKERLKSIWSSKDGSVISILEKFTRMDNIDKGIMRLGPKNLESFLAAFPIDEDLRE